MQKSGKRAAPTLTRQCQITHKIITSLESVRELKSYGNQLFEPEGKKGTSKVMSPDLVVREKESGHRNTSKDFS